MDEDEQSQQKWKDFYKTGERAVRWEGFRAFCLVAVPVALLGATGLWAWLRLFS